MGRKLLKKFGVSWRDEPEREPSRLAALRPQPRARSVPSRRSWSRAAPGDRARSGCNGSWRGGRNRSDLERDGETRGDSSLGVARQIELLVFSIKFAQPLPRIVQANPFARFS